MPLHGLAEASRRLSAEELLTDAYLETFTELSLYLESLGKVGRQY
jgi:hypothetical protein